MFARFVIPGGVTETSIPLSVGNHFGRRFRKFSIRPIQVVTEWPLSVSLSEPYTGRRLGVGSEYSGHACDECDEVFAPRQNILPLCDMEMHDITCEPILNVRPRSITTFNDCIRSAGEATGDDQYCIQLSERNHIYQAMLCRKSPYDGIEMAEDNYGLVSEKLFYESARMMFQQFALGVTLHVCLVAKSETETHVVLKIYFFD